MEWSARKEINSPAPSAACLGIRRVGLTRKKGICTDPLLSVVRLGINSFWDVGNALPLLDSHWPTALTSFSVTRSVSTVRLLVSAILLQVFPGWCYTHAATYPNYFAFCFVFPKPSIPIGCSFSVSPIPLFFSRLPTSNNLTCCITWYARVHSCISSSSWNLFVDSTLSIGSHRLFLDFYYRRSLEFWPIIFLIVLPQLTFLLYFWTKCPATESNKIFSEPLQNVKNWSGILECTL